MTKPYRLLKAALRKAIREYGFVIHTSWGHRVQRLSRRKRNPILLSRKYRGTLEKDT
jgi:hypothetical protein